MAKRVFVIVLGAMLLLVGIVIAIGGGALMVVFGSDNTVASGQQPLATSTTALVASLDDVQGTNGFATTVGNPTLRLGLTGSGRDVFIGIGPAEQVERYLVNSAIERVDDLEVDPFKLKTTTRDGAQAPAAPGSQTFWTAKASGAAPSLNWKVKDGSYRLVVMNADATANVQTTGSVGLNIPKLFAIGIGVLAVGIVIGLAGLALVIVGARMDVSRRPA